MSWSDSQVLFMNKVVKAHDRDLFAERSHLGHINIMRKAKVAEPVIVDDNLALVNVRESGQFVFALTLYWTSSPPPREWGAEVVLSRLKQHDAWNNERLLRELEEAEEKAKESKEREIKNKNEAWLADNHSRFKKAFSDVRVANMDKTERRRRRFEQRLEFKK